MKKTISECYSFESWPDRFEYLMLHGSVGFDTFGHDRYLNQSFYLSREWKDVRNAVLLRDLTCDLGVIGMEIAWEPIVHHINPMTKDDILDRNPDILDPEFLITVTKKTHNAIHYGVEAPIHDGFTERTPGDTKLW